MARFCTNCGKPIDAGDGFCVYCGAKVEGNAGQSVQTPQPPQMQQQPMQQPQYAPQPMPMQYMPQQYMYGAPVKPKKTGLIVGIIIAAVLILGLICAAVYFMSAKEDGQQPSSQSAPQDAVVSTQDTEEAAATVDEVEEIAETEPKLPYINDIERPAATDFAWIADAQSGNLSGTALGKDKFVGKWKAEYIFDGVWELVYITIDNDANITVEPYQVNYGEGWVDEMGEDAYSFDGSFDVGGVYGSGIYGSMTLYSFLEDYGTQYGIGTFTVQSGETAKVYLVRP